MYNISTSVDVHQLNVRIHTEFNQIGFRTIQNDRALRGPHSQHISFPLPVITTTQASSGFETCAQQAAFEHIVLEVVSWR